MHVCVSIGLYLGGTKPSEVGTKMASKGKELHVSYVVFQYLLTYSSKQ